MEKRYIPCLSIAGCDPSGGAGILADIKTFSALGVYGMAVPTALTAQNTQGVTAVYPVLPDQVEEQLVALFEDIHPQYIKVGMTGNKTNIEILVRIFRRYRPRHVVLDPIILSSSGHCLLDADSVDYMQHHLFPLCTLITPNLPEAATLLKRPIPSNRMEIESYGRQFVAASGSAVLIKGGHAQGEPCDNLFQTNGEINSFSGKRIESKNTHGTGCALSSAITAYLARGESLPLAVEKAKAYVYQAILNGRSVMLGQGVGPLQHFFHTEQQHFMTESNTH